MREPLNLALLLGSTREGRYCEKIATWTKQEILLKANVDLDVIDPLELDLPRRIERNDGDAVQALCKRIDKADAFVVVTPEYNHGYPAALKEVIDSAYVEWNAKPIAFVSYGGTAGGVRAVEQLRLVFAELHAVTIRDAVSFANPWDQFDDASLLSDPDRAQKAFGKMLSRLYWWAAALKRARDAWPYHEQRISSMTSVG